ncbi:MAG: TetR/AcrR family transcriptional regulator [Hyphomicrobiales bacterium]|nr:MAG: TetR/AcrR family transcriptional regulator [Hyphomicrobiales bacterium]
MIVTASPFRRESSFDRRAAIARAARELIVEKGVEGLRTRDIADRVGINIATLHYHVPTKEALFGLVAEAIRAEFAAQNAAHPRDGLSPKRQLELEFDDFEELLGARKDLLTAMSELLERARRDPEIKAGMFPLMGKWKEIVAEILAAGVVAGDFRPDLDPVPGAQMLIGAMIGFSRSPAPTPENFQVLRAELLRAVRNPFRKETHL